ncbi:MAG TPA: glycine betaine ABC transporter substrate-binding protein [Syntrophobacteria bacterium]|nr:glycine betaine ABC transporter substrate-binding protein [Syntrophobacteria bacterium]
MRRTVQLAVVLCVSLALALPAVAAEKKLVVGSKAFTEQRLLGQIMILLLEKNGFKAEDKTGLGGTLVVREALVNKQIDVCMEYTGTGLLTILKAPQAITDPVKCYEEVKMLDAKNGIAWLPYIPFNNTYCLMMRKVDAERLKIKTLSDLSQYNNENPGQVSFGLNAEFYSRPDGYKPLQAAYGFKFPEEKIIKMDPGLLYKALKEGQVQVAMGFSTDGRIREFDLLVLQDDKNYFPVYNPCVVVREETLKAYPELTKVFAPLSQKLDTPTITNLNFQVDGEHKPAKDVAKEWLTKAGLL